MFKCLLIAVLICIFVSSSAWSALTRDIAIAKFTNKSKNAELEQYTETISTLIFTHLAKSRKLSIVTRQELERILDEHGLKETGIIDVSNAAEIGRLAGARYMFVGQFLEFPGKTEARIRIATWLVDDESGRTIVADEVQSSITDLDNQAINLANNILRLLFPANPWGAAGLSLLVPGLGQLTNGRSSGYVFISLTFAALGGLGYTHNSYTQANEEYEEAKDNYDRISNLDRKNYIDLVNAEKKVQDTKDTRDSRNQLRMIALGTVAGVWLANVIDSFIEVRSLNKWNKLAESRVQLQSRIDPQGVQVLLATRF